LVITQIRAVATQLHFGQKPDPSSGLRRLAGAPLLELFPVVPIMGDETLNVGVFPTPGSSTSPRSPTGTAAPTSRCSPTACGPPLTTSRGRCSDCFVTRRDWAFAARKGKIMIATGGSGAQGVLASPPVMSPAAADHPGSQAERQRQLLLALTTEHFTLQTARSGTIADSNGRSALYLGTVSSAVVALAFIGQVARVGQAFFLFALALLPALVLLGVLTYLRLLQCAIEDLFYARAINRIRRRYVDLDPDAPRWFLLCGYDDPAGVMASMGLARPGAAPSHRHLLSHTASMVAVVTSIIVGVFVALAANAVGAGELPVAAGATVGILVAVACIAAFGWHQVRRWRAAENSVPSLFPSYPGLASLPDLDAPPAYPRQTDG
jgi:hypothetical protein